MRTHIKRYNITILFQFRGREILKMPYVTQNPEQCSSCDKQAVAKVVLMPNGFLIRCCAKHLLQLAEIKINA